MDDHNAEIMRSLGRIEASITGLENRVAEVQHHSIERSTQNADMLRVVEKRTSSLEVTRGYLKGAVAAVGALAAFIGVQVNW